MRDALKFPVLAACAALAGACTPVRTTCGEPSPSGGPPVIATRDADLCETVRLRVAEALARIPDISPERADRLRDFTWRWEDAATLDGLLRRVREDGGDDLAAAMTRAVDSVRTGSTRPVRAGCADDERCMVKGAALGARIAFDDAADVLRTIRRAQGGSGVDQERIRDAMNR